MYLKYKQTYDKQFFFAIISLAERLNLFGVFISVWYLYCKLSMHVLLYLLVSGCFYSFLFCYIIFFIIYFISSSERKGQELHYSMWKTRRMRCIFNILSNLLAENREICSFFSPYFSPPLHKCVSHHFHGTVSPKLLLAITSSTNLYIHGLAE